MALTYDQISAITQKAFIAKLADNIFDTNPLAARLKKNSLQLVDGGTSIIQPLGYAQATAAGWYQGAQTLDTTDNDVMTGAEYTWKQLYANITISRLDELKNSGDKAILNLVKQKTMIAEKTLIDTLGSGLYNDGTTANQIVGLRAIINTTGTVGGIDEAANSWWQGKVDSTTTTLSMGALQTQYNAATIDSDHPTVAMTTRTLFNSYYGLLQPQQRFMDSDTAKGGFQNLMFNGIPIISDSHCTSNYFFFINENYLFLYVHKDENVRFEPFVKPINQNVKIAKVYWAGALGSSNNRLHAKFSALTS